MKKILRLFFTVCFWFVCAIVAFRATALNVSFSGMITWFSDTIGFLLTPAELLLDVFSLETSAEKTEWWTKWENHLTELISVVPPMEWFGNLVQDIIDAITGGS